MKQPTFFSQLILALGLSVLMALLCFALPVLLGIALSLNVIIATVGCAYGLVFLRWMGAIRGRIIAGSLLLLYPVLISVFSLWTVSVLLTITTAIWLLRSTVYHQTLIGAVMDGSVCALSLMAAFLTYASTDSLVLSTWVFFLIQTLFIAIPGVLSAIGFQTSNNKNGYSFNETHATDEFGKAYRLAQSSLERIIVG